MAALESTGFSEILNDIEDYPIMPKPYSGITHYIIKDDGVENNVYPHKAIKGDPETVPDADQQTGDIATQHDAKDVPGINNPYHILSHNSAFRKKLAGLFQYGVDLQPIGEHTLHIHHHNRLMHSLDTAVNTEIIMRNNRFPEEKIQKAVLAALLHDIATPAFGDLTMKFFPQLKEETGFSKYMAYYPEKSAYIQQHWNISVDQLQSWIKNEDLIGKIIDITDRLAYTARDAYMSVGPEESLNVSDDSHGKKIQKIIKKDPRLADIIMEISLTQDNGEYKIVFENTKRLEDLLSVRAHMHNLIYLNPYLRSREEYFGLMLGYLVEK